MGEKEHLLPPRLATGLANEDYLLWYYAQVVHSLGDNGFAKLSPDAQPDQRVRWTEYRKPRFDLLRNAQNADGSWPPTSIGPVYTTALNLIVL